MKMRAGALLALAATVAAISPHRFHPRQEQNASEYPRMSVGSDEASDPATTSYFMNMVGLNTNNLTRSMEFYTSVFGFRHMFTYYLTPHLSFTYMAHSSGGRNRSAYQTTEELIRNKNADGGKLELVYFNTTGDDIPGSTTRTSTLNHLGIVVEDTQATQKRLEEYGVTILKKLGEPMPTEGPLADPFIMGDASGLSGEDWRAIQEAMGQATTLNIFCLDPDGNMIEIFPVDEGDLFG